MKRGVDNIKRLLSIIPNTALSQNKELNEIVDNLKKEYGIPKSVKQKDKVKKAKEQYYLVTYLENNFKKPKSHDFGNMLIADDMGMRNYELYKYIEMKANELLSDNPFIIISVSKL